MTAVSLTATLLSAPEDGVAPCFIVSLKPEKSYLRPTEYLFNIPEGLSRLALEHRIRPSLGLRAAFVTSVNATALGGLGGLILRLKQDGHGKLTLVGPSGTRAVVEGISQFIKWQHPELNVVELQQRSTPPVARCEVAAGKLLTGVQAAGVAAKPTAAAAPAVLEPSEGGVYEDDQIQVCCLWPGSVLWSPPSWLAESSTAIPMPSKPAKPTQQQQQQQRHGQQLSQGAGGAKAAPQDEVTRMASYSSGSGSGAGSDSSTTSSDSVADSDVGRDEGAAGEPGLASSSLPKLAHNGSRGAESKGKVETATAMSGSPDPSSDDSSSSSSHDSSGDSSGSEHEAGEGAGAGHEAAASSNPLFAQLDQFFASRQDVQLGAGGRGGERQRGRGRAGGRGRHGEADAGGGRGADKGPGRRGRSGGAGVRRQGAKRDLKTEVLHMLHVSAAAQPNGSAGAEPSVAGASAGAGAEMGGGPVGGDEGAGAAAGVQRQGGAVGPGDSLPQQQPQQHQMQQSQQQQQPRNVLGYLCHLRGTGQLLLLLSCPHVMQLPGLQRHPLIALLRRACRSGRLLATLHLSPSHVADTAQYRAFMHKLPGPQVWAGSPTLEPQRLVVASSTPEGGHAEAAGKAGARLGAGQPVTPVNSVADGANPGLAQMAAGARPGPLQCGSSGAQQPLQCAETSAGGGAGGGSAEGDAPVSGKVAGGAAGLGYHASTRVGSRLHLVSPMLFPLPFALRQQRRRPGRDQQAHLEPQGMGAWAEPRPPKGEGANGAAARVGGAGRKRAAAEAGDADGRERLSREAADSCAATPAPACEAVSPAQTVCASSQAAAPASGAASAALATRPAAAAAPQQSAQAAPSTPAKIVEAGLLWRISAPLSRPPPAATAPTSPQRSPHAGSSKNRAGSAPGQLNLPEAATPASTSTSASASAAALATNTQPTVAPGDPGGRDPRSECKGRAGAAWPDERLTADVSVAPLSIVPEEVQRQLLDSKGEALQRLIKELHSTVPRMKHCSLALSLLDVPPASAPLPGTDQRPGQQPAGAAAAAPACWPQGGQPMQQQQQQQQQQQSWQWQQQRAEQHGQEHWRGAQHASAMPSPHPHPNSVMHGDRPAPAPGWLATCATFMLAMQMHQHTQPPPMHHPQQPQPPYQQPSSHVLQPPNLPPAHHAWHAPGAHELAQPHWPPPQQPQGILSVPGPRPPPGSPGRQPHTLQQQQQHMPTLQSSAAGGWAGPAADNRAAAKRLKLTLQKAGAAEAEMPGAGTGIEQFPGTAGLATAVASGAAASASAAAPLTTTASGYVDPDSTHDPEGQGTAGEAALDWALPPGADEEPVPACLLCPEARESGLLFLGTGSAEPSKYRGPSAILLRVSGHFLLMDCGEGTWGQLLRWFGPAGAKAVVARLQCVWLSHKHADHVLGLPQLLSNRPPTAQPLLVVGPWEVCRWLEHVQAVHPGWRLAFQHCSAFDSQRPPQAPGSKLWQQQQEQRERLAGALGLVRWRSVAVQHCRDAWGLVVEHRCGWKLVYSGDTRPCRRLEQAGQGATLLVHEATFEPALLAMATSKRHSTSAEALAAARSMQAYRTILTHFSQRYPRMPDGLDAGSAGGCLRDRPAIAFDGMLVPLALLPALPLVVPVLAEALLKEEEA